MNVTEAMVKILKLEGIEWASCFPNNPLIEEMAKQKIRPVAFRHERGGGMAADGYSRMNDRQKFGVFVMQSQAGAENSVGALSQAYADNIPILVLPGAPAVSRLNVRPEFHAVPIYKNVTKQIETIYTIEDVIPVMRRAFNALRNGPPGPVVVETPSDIASKELPEELFSTYSSPQTALTAPSKSNIKEAVKTLLAAKKPVIWAGQGVLFAQATEQLRELAELTEIPVFTSMPGKSAIDERHPLSLGAGSESTTLPARTWVQESDVLFAIGSSLTNTPYGQSIPKGKLIIQNTINPDDINKDQSVEIGLIGDAKLTLEAIIDEVKGQIGEKGRKGSTSVHKEIADLKQQWLNEWMPLLTSNEEPINQYRLIWEINQNIDLENSVITHDAGAPREGLVPFFTATAPHSYIGWGKTTHLGFGIPLMIGAKQAFPEKFCMNYMGDGAFGMSGLDIETSVRAQIPITTIVLNNGGMATYPGRFPTARTEYGVSHMLGNYAQIAEGMGATGIVVSKTNEIAGALKKAQQLNKEGKTVLLDIHTNMEGRRSSWDR